MKRQKWLGLSLLFLLSHMEGGDKEMGVRLLELSQCSVIPLGTMAHLSL